jgi:opacity protein-like surface antigen
MRKTLLTLAIPLLLPLVLATHSARADGVSGYIGGGVGLAGSSVDNTKDTAAARAYGGLMFSEHYGLELGYIDFGKFKLENAPSGNNIEDNGGYLALSGFNWIAPHVELTGKLGGFYYHQTVHTNGVETSSDHGTSALLGVGMNFYLNSDVALGLEYDYLTDIESEHINSGWLLIHIFPGPRPVPK